MYKIYCLNNISPEGLALLTDNYEVTENIDEADAILVRSADMHEMEVPANLKAVARAGAGVNNIPLDKFAEAGIDKEFVQDNQSRSTRGVLRGLHFQKNHTQGKLVRVTKGEVYDVAVDCRPHSATFGKWVGVTLSEDNKKMFYIPEGFAHGFLVLSDVAEFCYKCTDVYDPTSEGGIPYDDPTVNVQWPDCGCEHKTSAKDKLHEPFAAQKFEYFEKW